MPEIPAMTIASYEERKAAVLRAAQLISSPDGSEGAREFALLTEAIADFDIRQDAEPVIEIPPGFMQFLAGGHRGQALTKRR